MRTLAVAVAVVMLAVTLSGSAAAAAGPVPAPSAGPGSAVPLLYERVVGESVGGKYVFSPSVIIIPSVPIVLNITFFNNQSVSEGVQHTFTINNNQGTSALDTGLVNPQVNVSVQFTINSMTSVTYQNKSFQPGPPPGGTDNGTIQWYCIPHVALGMKGTIILGSPVPAAGPETKGVFLRAYWIGMIGIASMIVWVGISYYVIKASTPRFKDHRGHVRKGLP